jgi:hypothetical protein
MDTVPTTPVPQVPADFPRERHPAGVSGAHPKLAVRKVGEQYVAGFSEEEIASRFARCDDLLLQLLPYCRRKASEHPEWGSQQLLAKVALSLRTKGWDLTDFEIDWLVKHLDGQLRT